jgi:hypothetical protein
MDRLTLDAGSLITSCRFSAAGQLVIDHLLDHCEIMVAMSVREEVVVAGARYSDAQAACQRIDRRRIAVLVPPRDPRLEAMIAPYDLGDGERDSILLTGHTELQGATLVIDDHLAYLVIDRLKRRKRFLLDVMAELVGARKLDRELAVEMVRAVSTRYPPAFVDHTLILLRR